MADLNEKNYPPEIDESEFADDDIVVLRSATGEDIRFIEIAGIAHKGKFYAILQPEELLEGMAGDEALVFLVERDEEGNDKFSIVLDDEIINAVFEQYYILYDKAHSDDEEK